MRIKKIDESTMQDIVRDLFYARDRLTRLEPADLAEGIYALEVVCARIEPFLTHDQKNVRSFENYTRSIIMENHI